MQKWRPCCVIRGDASNSLFHSEAILTNTSNGFYRVGWLFSTTSPLNQWNCRNIIRTVSNGRFYTLVGCQVSGSVSAGTGTGIVVPTYVVFGTSETNFEKIHAMRSNIPGLSPWSGISSLSFFPGDSSSKKTEVIAEPRNEIMIDESVGLKLRPDYSVRISSRRDEVTARQMVSIETRTDELRDWTWHLFYHRSLMNLLTISDWVPRTFADLEVLRDEDSSKLDGKEREVWHPVLSYMPRVDRSRFENPESQYLFRFSDIREEGIRKWLELVNRCQQGMTLLAYVAREQEHLAIETLNMLTGTMLDCIGWYVVKTKNQIKRMKRNSKTGEMQSAGFYQMLETVQEELGGVFPFTNKEDWKRDMRKAFVGNKHGDAEGVDFQTMYDVTMESLVIARMWVGLQLGADGNTLKERVSSDEIGKRVSRFIAW